MKKKNYVSLEMEITEFDTEDVITDSIPDTASGNDDLPFVPNVPNL